MLNIFSGYCGWMCDAVVVEEGKTLLMTPHTIINSQKCQGNSQNSKEQKKRAPDPPSKTLQKASFFPCLSHVLLSPKFEKAEKKN